MVPADTTVLDAPSRYELLVLSSHITIPTYKQLQLLAVWGFHAATYVGMVMWDGGTLLGSQCSIMSRVLEDTN